MTPGAVSGVQVWPASVERKNAGRPRAGDQHVRIGRVDGDRPDVLHRRGQVRPARRRLVPAEHAHVGAGEQPLGRRGMARDRPDARLQIHAGMAVRMNPGLAGVVAEPGGMAAGAGIDMRLRAPCSVIAAMLSSSPALSAAGLDPALAKNPNMREISNGAGTQEGKTAMAAIDYTARVRARRGRGSAARAPGDRAGGISLAADPDRHRLSARRRHRHPGTADGAEDGGAARPAGGRGEPSRARTG